MRQDDEFPAALELRTNEENIRVEWQRGEKKVPLPLFLRKAPQTYAVFVANRELGKLAVRLVQTSDEGIVVLAQQFLQNECYEQLDYLRSVTD